MPYIQGRPNSPGARCSARLTGQTMPDSLFFSNITDMACRNTHDQLCRAAPMSLCHAARGSKSHTHHLAQRRNMVYYRTHSDDLLLVQATTRERSCDIEVMQG